MALWISVRRSSTNACPTMTWTAGKIRPGFGISKSVRREGFYMTEQDQSGKKGLDTSSGENASPSVIEPADFRMALGSIASGVTVLTVNVGGETHGMTVASFCSVSLDPPLIAVAVGRHAHM